MMKLITLTLLAVPALLAQDFRGQIKVKPLLPPLSQPWKTSQFGAEFLLRKVPAQSKTCSVPLLQVTPQETDPKSLITPKETNSRMLNVVPPAPPCEKGTTQR